MAEQLYTRCPECKTVFRVTPAQLAVRAGQVRCGQCQTVFDGAAALIPRSGIADVDREVDPGPVPADAPLAPAAAAEPAIASGEIGYQQRFSWDRTQRRRRSFALLYAIGAPLLAVLLALQALFHFRDAIAARWPGAAPALTELCGFAGCRIEAPRDIDGLVIEGSDLKADAAHRGLLILTATVRNRTPLPIAYPHIELTLTDARDQTVASRALAPRDYAPTADLARGVRPGSEASIHLFIDASATEQAGYRLYLFYP